MSDEFAGTIATLTAHLQKQEEEVRSTKRLINQLCQRGGTSILYPEAEADSAASLGSLWRDQFYGVPLATAIRKYLEMRRQLGPATVNDIYGALRAGGFVFEAKNDTNAKRSLYISLAKNSVTFHKLPGAATDEGGVFGLMEWYPNTKSDDDTKKTKKVKKPKKATPVKRAAIPPAPVKADNNGADSPAPEKGVSNVQETRSAGSAARKKHNPAPVA